MSQKSHMNAVDCVVEVEFNEWQIKCTQAYNIFFHVSFFFGNSFDSFELFLCYAITWIRKVWFWMTIIFYVFIAIIIIIVIPLDNIKYSLVSMYLFGFGVGKGEKKYVNHFFFSFSVYFFRVEKDLFLFGWWLGLYVFFWVKWYMQVDKCHDPPPAFVRIIWYPYLHSG